MEIKITTQKMLQLLQVLSWIIFIGLCVEAGAIVIHPLLTALLDPSVAGHLWREVDLSGLYAHDRGYFYAESLLIGIVAVLRAVLFYLIVKILHRKQLDFASPFNAAVGRFLSQIAYLSAAIGVFSLWGAKYAEWFATQGISMPDLQQLRLDGADVWLFMGIVLLVIAQIFKRGIELQSENELTI